MLGNNFLIVYVAEVTGFWSSVMQSSLNKTEIHNQVIDAFLDTLFLV